MNSCFTSPSRRCLLIPVAAALLVFSGCATTNRVALATTKQSAVQTVQPVILVPQQEIGVDIQHSNLTAAAGGGLLFAVIDSAIDHSRAKKAEGSVTTLRDALVDFDFGKTLAAAIKTGLPESAWPKIIDAQVRHDADSKLARNLPGENHADGVLILDTDYRLTSGFAEIAVTAKVALHLRGEEAPSYLNTFSVLWSLPQNTASVSRIEGWSESNGAPARDALEQCCREIAAMIAYDAALPAEASRPPKDGVKQTVYGPQSRLLRGPMTRGTLEKMNHARNWVRMPTGELVSVST